MFGTRIVLQAMIGEILVIIAHLFNTKSEMMRKVRKPDEPIRGNSPEVIH